MLYKVAGMGSGSAHPPKHPKQYIHSSRARVQETSYSCTKLEVMHIPGPNTVALAESARLNVVLSENVHKSNHRLVEQMKQRTPRLYVLWPARAQLIAFIDGNFYMIDSLVQAEISK